MLKPKEKQELFKQLQEVFFVRPRQDGMYTLTPSGARYAIRWRIETDADFKARLSPGVRRKFAPGIAEPVTRFGVMTLTAVLDGTHLTVRSEDSALLLEPAFECFNKADRDILSILAARCLDYRLICARIAAAAGMRPEDLQLRCIPKDVLALRVFVNSTNLPLGAVDVSSLTDLTYAFSIYDRGQLQENKRTDFSGVETWDTGRVTRMVGTFAGCVNFNADVGRWNTAAVTHADVMFASCKKFNRDLSAWRTSALQSMKGMFYKCESFNQDLSGWDTSRVRDMSYCFIKCRRFDQDLSGWNTERVQHDEGMFDDCPLSTEKKPRSPGNDLKRSYYDRYVGPDAKRYARQETMKKIGLAAAVVILAVVFSIYTHGGA